MYSTTCQRDNHWLWIYPQYTRRFYRDISYDDASARSKSFLSKHINEAKDRLNHLKDLSKEDIKDYQTRIDRAKDDSKIDAIIEDARQHNES